MSKNIEMNYKISDGYEVVYPQVQIQNVINLQSNINSLQSQINQRLPLSGGTMTGNLILKGNPSSTNQAANKGYVDSQIIQLSGNIGFTILDVVKSDGVTWSFPGDAPNLSTAVNLKSLFPQEGNVVAVIWEIEVISITNNREALFQIEDKEDLNQTLGFFQYSPDNVKSYILFFYGRGEVYGLNGYPIYINPLYTEENYEGIQRFQLRLRDEQDRMGGTGSIKTNISSYYLGLPNF